MSEFLTAASALFAWLETTSVARAVAESAALTAWLSAIHVLGYTLVTGGALVANLRMLGALFPQRPMLDVSRPAARAVMLGLLISTLTGVLLFSARAASASANGTFQLKMLLLATAVLFHFTAHRRAAANESAHRARAIGALGLSVWVALAAVACAFILFE
jgi:hypothetical protein